MRPLASFATALGAGAALVSLAACAGGGSQVAPGGAAQGTQSLGRAIASVSAAGPISLAYPAELRGIVPVPNRSELHFVDPASVKAQIDAAQYGPFSDAGEVNEYAASNPKNKAPFCSIGTLYGVNAIATDAAGNLWVPNVGTGSVNQVYEYAPDCGKLEATLNAPDGQPVDIAFASNGITYVSDILGPNSGNLGNIAVYPKGQTSPSTELTNPAVYYSQGVAVDSKNNVYQSYIGNASLSGGGVLEFKAGKGKGAILKGIAIAEPGVVITDSKDDLIVTDQNALTLNTYAPPYKKLTSSFALKAQTIECALNKAETNVACGDLANDAVDVYAYPKGTYQYSFSNGLSPSLTTIGVAQDPL
jgi:hypothetical protein